MFNFIKSLFSNKQENNQEEYDISDFPWKKGDTVLYAYSDPSLSPIIVTEITEIKNVVYHRTTGMIDIFLNSKNISNITTDKNHITGTTILDTRDPHYSIIHLYDITESYYQQVIVPSINRKKKELEDITYMLKINSSYLELTKNKDLESLVNFFIALYAGSNMSACEANVRNHKNVINEIMSLERLNPNYNEKISANINNSNTTE